MLCSGLQEAERLKQENEELRKLGEDAVLDQQLNKALQETDKLKLAADAYKKELLQQKVTELQSELKQTSKRLKTAEEEKAGQAELHADTVCVHGDPKHTCLLKERTVRLMTVSSITTYVVR